MAEMVVTDLAEDPQGLTFVQQALRLSWRWLGGATVKAEDIDEYVDGPTDNFTKYHVRYYEKPMAYALGTAYLAVAYAGRQAFEAEGPSSQQKMSEPMAEVTEDILAELLAEVKKTSHYDEAALQRVVSMLIQPYQGRRQR